MTTNPPIEAWQLEDAERLKALFKTHAKLTQAEFGAQFEIGNQGYVWQLLNGRRPLSIDTAQKFARGLGIPIDDFSPTLAAKIASASNHLEDPKSRYIPDLESHPGVVAIRKVIFKISAGIAGFSVEYLDNGDGEPIFQPESWFSKRGIDAATVYAARVSGHSMEPKYLEGDVVMIDTGNTKREKDAVYAFNHEGEFTIKRLMYKLRRWYLVSDNSDQKVYAPQECTDATHILGRVVLHLSESL